MFAKENENNLSLDKKYFCEIISFISLLFSCFVTFVSIKKIKMTITNVLIMQIILAEILDGINIILAILIDSYGEFTFENYPGRMGFCLTQIYLGVFSCLWNLFSSLFISIRIYDRMQNKNRIFKNKFMYQYSTTMSYGIPSIITYILWSSQVLSQSKTLQNKTYDDYYVKENKSDFFRYMYCWVSQWNNNSLFILSFLLIAANFYFSIFKSAVFVRKISKEIEETQEEDGRSKKNQIKKIKKITTNLILYPIVSGIVWIIYFVLQILTGYISGANKIDSIADSMKNGVGSWLIILIICIRQIIFTIVFFLTQGNLKKHAYNMITCKKSKENSSSISSSKIINDSDNYKILSESHE